MKTFKKIIIAVVALIALLVLALIMVPMFYSIDDLRPQIQTAIEQQVRGKVQLGKLSLRLFPDIRVNVDGVTATPNGAFGKEPLAKIAGVSLKMPLASFLIGPQVTVEIVKPEITMINKGTESNLASFLPEPPTPQEAPQAKAETTNKDAAHAAGIEPMLNSLPGWLASRVRAARISIEVDEGAVAMRDLLDPAKGNKTELHKLGASLKNIGIAAPIQVRADFNTDVVKGDMRVAGPIKATGLVTAVPQGAGFKVLLDLDTDLAGLDAKMAALFHKKPGVPMNAGIKGTVLQGERIDVSLDTLEFRFGDFSTKGSLELENAALPEKAKVKMALKSGQVAIAPFGAIVPMIQDFKLDGKVNLSLDVQGPMLDPTFNIDVGLADITGATPQLKHPVTGLNGKITVTGTAKNPSVKIDPLAMKLASSDLAVKVITQGLAPIVANISVVSKRLDADELLGLETLRLDAEAPKGGVGGGGGAGGGAGGGGKVAPPPPAAALDETLNTLAPTVEEVLKNPMLDKIKANVVLDFKSIKALGAEFNSASLNLNYANQDLKITKTGIGGYGGRVSLEGGLKLDPKALGYDFKGGLSGVKLTEMTRVHAPKWNDMLTGTLTGDFSINGRGLRKEQLAQNLGGGLKGNIVEGRLALPIVQVLQTVIQAVNKLPSALSDKAMAEAKGKEYRGEFKTLKLVSVIKGRTVELQDLDVNFDSMKAGLGDIRFQANGTVTFDQQVDVTGVAYVSPDLTKALASLKGSSGKAELPLRMKGPMASPKPDIDYTLKIVGPRLLQAALKGKAAESAKKALAPQIEQLKQQAPAPVKKQIDSFKKKFGF